MCEFVSWIEYNKELYFLTNADLETKDGKKLLEPWVIADICGHGAIINYYPELKDKGIHKECTDFSTPANFPKKIVNAIKKGKLSRFGICLEVLNKTGKKEYLKIEQSAYAESAYAEYDKIKQSAFTSIVRQKKYRAKNWK